MIFIEFLNGEYFLFPVFLQQYFSTAESINSLFRTPTAGQLQKNGTSK